MPNRGGVRNGISLIGGKLTTYRNCSEEIVDEVYKKLGRATPPCVTAVTPLPGAIEASDPAIATTLQRYGDRLPALSISHLFDLYGSKAPQVLALGDEAPELFEPIAAGLPGIKAQAVYAVRCEYARTLTDIVHRRTSLSALDGYGCQTVSAIADVLIRHCNWDPQLCAEQVNQHRIYMQENYIPDYAENPEIPFAVR